MNRFTHDGGHDLTVAGARLYVEVRGNPEAPPLLFLPGGFGDIEDFNRLTPALAPHFRLVGIDSRGQGASTPGDAAPSYARLQADVEAVAAALGIPEADVLGYSDGGITGLRLAALGALRVRRLATIGAQWTLPADDPVRAFAAEMTPERMRDLLPRNHATYLRVNPAPDFAALTAATARLWLDEAGYPGEAIRRIACPLLVIRGEDDDLVPASQSAGIAERVPGARLLTVASAGHDAHWREPEAVADALLRFLTGPPGA